MGRFLSGGGAGFGTGIDGLPHAVPVGGIAIIPGPRPGYVIADGLNEYVNGPRSRNLLTTIRRPITGLSIATVGLPGQFSTSFASSGTRIVVPSQLGNEIISTTNGITWDSNSVPSPASGAWGAVRWNGSVFVAFNANGSDVITSADGATWATSTGLSTASLGISPPRPSSVAVIGNLFVVSYSANATQVFTSSNGTAWAGSNLPQAVSSQAALTSMVASSGAMYLASNSTNRVLQLFRSTNGTQWTNLSANITSLRSRSGRPLGPVRLLAASPSGVIFAAVDEGSNGTLVASYNAGETWTVVERFWNSLNGGWRMTFALGLFWFFATSESAAGNPGTSSGADVYTSVDGITWERRALPGGVANVVSVEQLGSSLVAASFDSFDASSAAAIFTAEYTNTNRVPVGPAVSSGIHGGNSSTQAYMRVL